MYMQAYQLLSTVKKAKIITHQLQCAYWQQKMSSCTRSHDIIFIPCEFNPKLSAFLLSVPIQFPSSINFIFLIFMDIRWRSCLCFKVPHLILFLFYLLHNFLICFTCDFEIKIHTLLLELLRGKSKPINILCICILYNEEKHMHYDDQVMFTLFSAYSVGSSSVSSSFT